MVLCTSGKGRVKRWVIKGKGWEGSSWMKVGLVMNIVFLMTEERVCICEGK